MFDKEYFANFVKVVYYIFNAALSASYVGRKQKAKKQMRVDKETANCANYMCEFNERVCTTKRFEAGMCNFMHMFIQALSFIVFVINLSSFSCTQL